MILYRCRRRPESATGTVNDLWRMMVIEPGFLEPRLDLGHDLGPGSVHVRGHVHELLVVGKGGGGWESYLPFATSTFLQNEHYNIRNRDVVSGYELLSDPA